MNKVAQPCRFWRDAHLAFHLASARTVLNFVFVLDWRNVVLHTHSSVLINYKLHKTSHQIYFHLHFRHCFIFVAQINILEVTTGSGTNNIAKDSQYKYAKLWKVALSLGTYVSYDDNNCYCDRSMEGKKKEFEGAESNFIITALVFSMVEWL